MDVKKDTIKAFAGLAQILADSIDGSKLDVKHDGIRTIVNLSFPADYPLSAQQNRSINGLCYHAGTFTYSADNGVKEYLFTISESINNEV